MKWKKAMSGAYQLACEKAAKIYTSGKNNIAGKRKVWGLCLAICASTKYIKERGGPGELRSYWEVVIYQVVHQTSYETSVFKVIPKFREGKTITQEACFPLSLAVEKPNMISPQSQRI